MAEKLWGGRFSKPPSQEMFDFLSLEDAMLDEKLALYDIEGNLAHVAMLCKQEILPKEEAGAVLGALLKMHKLAQEGNFRLDYKLEDVHTNVEAAVTKITPFGKKMHTARSRNDQVSLDTRMYMRDAINELSSVLLQLQQSLLQLSKKDCPFPTYTHFQVAQPASLCFWAHAHWNAIERDLQRLGELYGRVNVNPLGSGAVAGTTWGIDRNYTSKLLGFSAPTANPLDTVSNRGEFEAELLSVLLGAVNHCSRMAEDVILLSNKRLVLLPDEYSTGSSMMPQKKNPDPLELVRGKAARMLGLYVHASSLLKGLPSGYNKDSQESKFAAMQGVDTSLAVFSIMAKILPKLQIDGKKVAEELEEGYACTTELADLLAKKGVPFRDAHEMTGKLVKDCMAKKKYLSQLSYSEVSKLAGVKLEEKEFSEAVNVDKVKRFAAKYAIPSSSAYAAPLSARKKVLEAAHELLLKDVRGIIG
jgi:argininosuccinate lyase